MMGTKGEASSELMPLHSGWETTLVVVGLNADSHPTPRSQFFLLKRNPLYIPLEV
jgi:hypothetical protein